MTPYGFIDQHGDTKGYVYEIAKAFLNDADVDYEISLLPLKRLFKESGTGKINCSFLAGTQKTKEIFRLIEPMGKDIIAGVLPKKGKIINQYEDLAAFTIGVPLGVYVNERFDKDLTLNKTTTHDYAHSVKMLVAGRIDAIMGNIDSFRYFSAQSGYNPDDIFGDPHIFASIPFWLVCNKDSPSEDIIDRLKASIQKLRDNGTFQSIIGKY
ncbi:MAG: transporter substrate-binding domain-containing protein [Rhodospirillales bacterium]|nr:transporter substrate-binding domain-containing protein [Rhodospirillales bacterium]